MLVTKLERSDGIELLLSDKHASWTPATAGAIFDHLYVMSEDPSTRYMQFNTIGIRCKWTPYPSIKQAATVYSRSPKKLMDATTVLFCENSKEVVVRNF